MKLFSDFQNEGKFLISRSIGTVKTMYIKGSKHNEEKEQLFPLYCFSSTSYVFSIILASYLMKVTTLDIENIMSLGFISFLWLQLKYVHNCGYCANLVLVGFNCF